MWERLWGVVAGLTVLCAGVPAHATTYDLVAGFSGSNPNGVWSYVANGSLMGTYSAACPGSPTGIACWSNNQSVPNLARVEANTTSGALTNGTVVYSVGYLNIDPQSIANAGVQFTAPTTGTYGFSGNFIGDDSTGNSHGVSIVLNGSTSLFSGAAITGTSSTDTFSFNQPLTAGDTVLFTVGQGTNNPSYAYLTTGLQGTITLATPSVPEPESLTALAVGLLGLALMRRKPA